MSKPLLINIKPGVKLNGIRPEIIVGLMAAISYHPKTTVTITSALEGKHMRSSKHYIGQAIDLRTDNIDFGEAARWRNQLAVALGRDFDIILEEDHLHIEFDPKGEIT